MKILAIDVGSGTQDVLYFIDNIELENCPKFILPSPAMMIAKKIQKLTAQDKNIYLYGNNMGGGFKWALKAHLNKGLKVACSQEAAYALADNLKKVESMGIEITDTPYEGYFPVYLTDFDPGFWENFLSLASLDYPDQVLVAAQDHGFFPNLSNRAGRFSIWKEFLKKSGHVKSLIYKDPDPRLTRLCTIKRMVGNGYVADTGGAAILGALFDEEVRQRKEEGVCIVNIGNSHTIAFLIHGENVLGILEHHTGMLDGKKLWDYLERFRKGHVTNNEVFEDMGHGCAYQESANFLDLTFSSVYVIGPKREMLKGYPVRFIAPGGDMMLTGALGLINGYFLLKNSSLFCE